MNFSHPPPVSDQCRAVLIVALLFLYGGNSFAQVVENTDNQSEGTSSTFVIKVNSSHGVSTSISKTKEIDASATATLIVGPNSTSIQENKDGASAFIAQDSGLSQGNTAGVSGFQRINFGEGTRYDASLRSLTKEEYCSGVVFCVLPDMGSGSASANGNTVTSLTVESNESSFVNSFIRSFEAQ